MKKTKLLKIEPQRPISPDDISNKILIIRDKKVMLDSDLAKLYGVPTYRLNESVKRNIDRFPSDFMFKLTQEECKILTSQFAISRFEWGGRRYIPSVFTEQGVAMLSSVLNSNRAIHVNIEIMRAFAKIREMILSHKELQQKINEMEKKYNKNFAAVFEALRQLLSSPTKSSKRIGFHDKEQP